MSPSSRAGLFAALLPLCPPLYAQDPAADQTGSAYRVPVTGVRAQSDTIRLLTRVQGVIEAIDAPEIRSKVAAEVVEVNVDEGDPVQAEQVLARLDDEGFRLDKEAAEADIQRLQALLENQQSTLQRDQSLTQQKLVSDAKLDDSRAAVKQTRAQLAHARSLLAKAQYQLSHTRVIAPIDGMVQQRSVSRGDYVNPNAPSSKVLFQIVDTGRLHARIWFPENLARLVAIGMQVELTKEGDRVATRIAHVRPMLEPGNGALHALADFDNGPRWKTGESIAASAVLQEHAEALVVPAAVLVRRPAGLVVYRLDNGRAREVAVTTGIRQGDRVEILSGVAADDLLALDGANYLSDGVMIDIKDEVP